MRKSTILTIFGAAGVIGTSVMAVKATPKAMALLEEAREEKEELTKLDIVKVAAPAYIPAIVIGVSTVACIFGANVLNKHQQASMASAYALLSSSYNKYKHKVMELYGDEADQEVTSAIAKDDYDNKPYLDEFEIDENAVLFYDVNTMQYFNARLDDVIQKTTMDDGMEVYTINTPFDLPPGYWYM